MPDCFTQISLKSLILFLFIYQGSMIYIPNISKYKKILRNKSVLEKYYNTTLSIKELGYKYEISSRTVYRIIKNGA